MVVGDPRSPWGKNADKQQKGASTNGDADGEVKKWTWTSRIPQSKVLEAHIGKRLLKDSPSSRYTKGAKMEDRKINADNHLIVFGLY